MPVPKEDWKCPSCNEMVSGYPALSRKDNKTYICSACGLREAYKDYKGFITQHK